MQSSTAAKGSTRCFFSGARVVVAAACMIVAASALNFEPGGVHRHSSNISIGGMAAGVMGESVMGDALNDIGNAVLKFIGDAGTRAQDAVASEGLLRFGDLLHMPDGAARNDSLLGLFGQGATWETSRGELLRKSSQCYRDLEANQNQSYKQLPLQEVCQLKQMVELPGDALSKKDVAFVFPVYGESIFDDYWNCAVCVAVLSLLCSGTQDIPIVVMYTPEVPEWQLRILSSVFPVQLKEVLPIELNHVCAEQSQDKPRLQHVLMKLWYWGLTEYKQVMVLDADVLIVNPLDDMVTHPLEGARIGAALDKGRMRCTDPRYPYGQVAKDNANYSNGGVVIAKPSHHTLKKLLRSVPLMQDCSSVVEQSLLWEKFPKRVEIPPAYNCRHTHIHRCCAEQSPIKIMHFAGPAKAFGPEQALRYWKQGDPAESYIRLWNYLHYQFLGHLCPSSQ